jgi:hypothetical protein
MKGKLVKHLKHLFLVFCAFTFAALASPAAFAASGAGDLVLAANGTSDYQVIIPDKAADPLTDQWLLVAGKLIATAFQKNGFSISVARESQRNPNKPAIYLGDTAFARQNGVKITSDDWTYAMKAVGKNLIIAGNDHEDKMPMAVVPGEPRQNVALLGTVKGVCDFLREYAGVRFLFINYGNQAKFLIKNGQMQIIKPDGSLDIDTRSIAFLPVKQIAVPADLNFQKTPPLLVNQVAANYETFYFIANNFFPNRQSVQGAALQWFDVIPADKYAASHPEYFALLPNGKRVTDPTSGYVAERRYGKLQMPLSVANPDVQSLMVDAVEQKIKEGASTVLIYPMDAFWLDQSNDPADNALFGMPAKNMDQIRARGYSGNLWKVYFSIAKRVSEKYPNAKIMYWAYQDSPISGGYAREVKTFPSNIIVKGQFHDKGRLDSLNGMEFPGGIANLSESFSGWSYMGKFAPERTNQYAGTIPAEWVKHHIIMSTADGSMGFVPGLQGPAYYAFGQILDDTSVDWQDLSNEFTDAAFGKAAGAMRTFYNLQDRQMALMSDYFGVVGPLTALGRNRVNGTYNTWYFLSVYTPEYMSAANDALSQAERSADSPDVKARLHLIRIRFDYLCGLAKILTLQNAWTVDPTNASFGALLDALDSWHASMRSMTDETDPNNFKTLSDWPTMSPFQGGSYIIAAQLFGTYQQAWYLTSLAWDTEAIRAGILTKPHEAKVLSVSTEPTIDSKEWDSAPALKFLRESDGMPVTNTPTTMQVLRDDKNLYVRMDIENPNVYVPDIHAPKTENEVLNRHHVDLAIQPVAGGPIYHLAANPVQGARYDAVIKGNGKEDVSWNGTWSFTYEVGDKRNQYFASTYTGKWTALFTIPFSAFGVSPPAAGNNWGFNAGRQNPDMIWSNGSSVTAPQSLGKLMF